MSSRGCVMWQISLLTSRRIVFEDNRRTKCQTELSVYAYNDGGKRHVRTRYVRNRLSVKHPAYLGSSQTARGLFLRSKTGKATEIGVYESKFHWNAVTLAQLWIAGTHNRRFFIVYDDKTICFLRKKILATSVTARRRKAFLTARSLVRSSIALYNAPDGKWNIAATTVSRARVHICDVIFHFCFYLFNFYTHAQIYYAVYRYRPHMRH